MIFAYYFFAAVLLYLSWKSFRSGLAYRRYFSERLAAQPLSYEPFATIIAPCRGVDRGFAQNLERLFGQKYPAFEIIFVVDDEDDESVRYIREAIAANSHISSKLIVAYKATNNAQKAENLREAVLHASELSEVFAFVDSDARVSAVWLSRLVASLGDERVGASTGYRWFVSDRPSLADELLSAWNASIASALGPNRRSNFTWGGSTAIRRETFDNLGVREKWSSIVAEDFVVARAVQDAGLEVEFVPQALCASETDVSLRELGEFTTRQIKITRVYRPDLWLLSMFGSAVFTGVLAASLVFVLAAGDLLTRVLALITLIGVGAFSIAKSVIRAKTVAMAIPEHGSIIHRQALTHSLLFWATPPLFLANCLAALFSRRIRWRGRVYDMLSASETRVLR
jgi:ceramide glucosyltransferase